MGLSNQKSDKMKSQNELYFIETNITKEKQFNTYNADNSIEIKENEITDTKSRCRVTSRNANTLFLLLRINLSKTVLCHPWIFVLLFLQFVTAHKEQRFAIEPQDQSAVVGSRVTLPCRVVNKVGQLQWTKDDFGLGTHRHLVGYERYKMIGSDEEGDYSLDIRDVTLDDDALYQCQVSSGPRGEQPIRSRYARLLILVPPDPPRILQGESIQMIEDRQVDLECVSVGGKPAAEITWVDNDGGVVTQGVIYSVEQMSDGRRYTARSVLTLHPRRHHHNQTFTCQAQNTADRAYRAAVIRLEVKYAPKVRIFFKTGNKRKVQEGESLTVGCQATANPDDLTFKWYINNEQMIGNFTSELVIKNISRTYNEATVKCEVFNNVGKSADTKTLEVTYGPSFIIKPKDVAASDGASITLNCIVDGHPPPNIMWLHYEKNRIIKVGKSSNLTISVSHNTAGQYWCRATVDGHNDIDAPANVYLEGPPKILSNRTQYGVEGDSVRVDCIAFAVPKPDYVLWTYGGNEINSFHNQEYAILEESLPDGLTKSTLIIRESQLQHFGSYNCTVTNSHGSDSIEIRLIPDKSFPLIMIISGGASSAILVLIIMLIIMLCHRRKRKNIPNDEKKKPDITDLAKVKCEVRESDRNSCISDLKLELRHLERNELEASNLSETEFHTNMHLATNLGLPLAGPVTVPPSGFENELMKQYQRYSNDFSESAHMFKAHNQNNGYIPYVDYARDYAPPIVHSNDSLNGSMSRSIDTTSTVPYSSQNESLRVKGSCNALNAYGPDVIPLSNPGVCLTGAVDVRYAATYGNPYLRVNGSSSYASQANTANPSSTPAPPPYCNKGSTLHVTGKSASPSSLSSKSASSSVPSTVSSGAQPQVPKTPPQSSNALYILPPSSQTTQKNISKGMVFL